MNKQEVLKKLEQKKETILRSQKNLLMESELWGLYEARATTFMSAINIVEQLDEPQKVKVPEFVVEWFEENKHNLNFAIYELYEAGKVPVDLYEGLTDFERWFYLNHDIDTLIRMQDGYEVEEEPLYTVTINLDRKYHLVLDEGDGDDEISTTLTTRHGVLGYRYFLTEKEIKSIDERYWPFAVLVEEVAEG